MWRRKRSELFTDDETTDDDLLPGIASLFNGALFSAHALEVVGVPDLRLFFRGDEVEIHRRLQRSGLAFGTCLTTGYLHPDGADEFRPILGGRMHTQYPDNEVKRFFTYRNRGYLMSQPGMRKLLPQEYARFGWYFLISSTTRRVSPNGCGYDGSAGGNGSSGPNSVIAGLLLGQSEVELPLPLAEPLRADPLEDVEFLLRVRRPEMLDLPGSAPVGVHDLHSSRPRNRLHRPHVRHGGPGYPRPASNRSSCRKRMGAPTFSAVSTDLVTAKDCGVRLSPQEAGWG